MSRHRRFLVELAIAIALVACIHFYSAHMPEMEEVADANLMNEPNLAEIDGDLKELRWKIQGQQSMSEQIHRMAKE